MPLPRQQRIQLALVQIGNEVERLQTYHSAIIEQQGGVGGSASERPWSDVDKTKLPSACFLWVEDAKRKGSWHLPYKEGTGGISETTGMYASAGPVNLNALRAIAAALGGARTGKPMNVPSEVRRKAERLFERYKIGRYAEQRKEQTMHNQRIVEERMDDRFAEAVLDKEACIVRDVAIVNPTSVNCSYKGGKGRRFSERARQSVARLLEGKKAYRNHQGKTEEKDMGGVRRTEDQIGKWANGRLTESGLVRADLHYLRINAVKEWIEAIVEQMPETIGSSINALGDSVYNETEKMEDVEDITGVHSVDIVTSPGSTKHLFESNKDDNGGDAGSNTDGMEDGDLEIAAMTLAELREARPDLVDAVVKEQKDSDTTVATITGLKEQVASVTKERDEQKVKLDEATLKEQVREREVAIDKAITESGIRADDISESFRTALSAATDDGTIKALLDDRKKIIERAKEGVRGMGDEGDGGGGSDDGKKVSDEQTKKDYQEAAGVKPKAAE